MKNNLTGPTSELETSSDDQTSESSRTQPSPPPPQLSKPQMEAVNHLEGPLVVFSGAGSGKTRVIVSRIAKLIEFHQVHPGCICALTFTNKAAREMKERAMLLTHKAKSSLISTFHSAAARWLREFSNRLGFDNTFSILTPQESDVLLKQILKKIQQQFSGRHDEDFPIHDQSLPLKKYRHFIQQLKVQALTPHQPYCKIYCQDKGPSFAFQVYVKYQQALKRTNSMDFGDLLLHILTLLKTQPEVKQTLQRRYKFFLVDEYQDVNTTQFEIITHLVPPPYNLMVVGDDDQSIYSWRGADPKNILNFKQNYPTTQIIHLEQNYRSTAHIIRAANTLISTNKIRVEKQLWTLNPPGELIDHFYVTNGFTEAHKVCELIRQEFDDVPLTHIAIFYRINAQSREIEDALVHHQIPYKIYGSLRFYDRLEIKDMLAYMRLAVNPKDDSAFLRIIKAPTRQMGAKTIEELLAVGSQYQLSLYETLQYLAAHQDAQQQISNRLRKIVQTHAIALSKTFGHMRETPVNEMVNVLLRHVDYRGHLKKNYPDTVEDKMENLEELGAAMSAYFDQDSSRTLRDWVQDVSLVGSEKEEVPGVSLMTLHAAKGLEFPRVYMIGCDDGLLPHKKVIKEEDHLSSELEEERRLMYVGMTRAKIKLSLFSASQRRSYYEWQCYRPSRFVAELPPELLDVRMSHDVS